MVSRFLYSLSEAALAGAENGRAIGAGRRTWAVARSRQGDTQVDGLDRQSLERIPTAAENTPNSVHKVQSLH